MYDWSYQNAKNVILNGLLIWDISRNSKDVASIPQGYMFIHRNLFFHPSVPFMSGVIKKETWMWRQWISVWRRRKHDRIRISERGGYRFRNHLRDRLLFLDFAGKLEGCRQTIWWNILKYLISYRGLFDLNILKYMNIYETIFFSQMSNINFPYIL